MRASGLVGLRLLMLLVLAAAAGCAAPTTRHARPSDEAVAREAQKQREIALMTFVDRYRRLDRVAYPLLRAAVPFCTKRTTRAAGLRLANRHSFPKDLRDAAARLFGADEAVRVLYVLPGGPAEAAGLQPGDVLAKIGGRTVPAGPRAVDGALSLLREALAPGRTVSLGIVRQGRPMDLSLSSEEICDYGVLLAPGDEVNAYADGKRIAVTRGMMRFVESDRELALVVSHEIAHNAMRHIDARRRNYLLGSLLDLVAAAYGINTQGLFGQAAAQAYSQEFESEADYVGLYVMARAGMPIEGAALFWRRMAAEHPGSIRGSHTSTHPATAQRFAALELAVREIRAKRQRGEPLLPEMKARRKAGADGGRWSDGEEDI